MAPLNVRRRFVGAVIVLSAVMAVALFWGAATPVLAQPDCPPEQGAAYPPEGVTMSPSSITTGVGFTLSISGLPSSRSGVQVQLWPPGAQIFSFSATDTTNPTGGLSIQVPPQTASGTYTVRVVDDGPAPAINRCLDLSIVAPPPDTTPTTTAPTTTTTTTTLPPPTTVPAPTTVAPPPTTVPAPTTTAPPPTTVPPTTTIAPPPPTTVPPVVPLAPAPPPVPLDPGERVQEGGIGFVRDSSGDGPVNLIADGLAPAAPVVLTAQITQLLARVTLDPDSFAPGSGFDAQALLSEVPQGASVVNAVTSRPADQGQTGPELVAELAGSPELRTFPELNPADPLITEARDWLVMDISVAGATPGSEVTVVWFSDPVVLAVERVAGTGSSVFQVAVPDTLITAGESDSLRVFAEYGIGEATTDAQGTAVLPAGLPPALAAISEEGSRAVLIGRGQAADGQPVVVSVELTLDAVPALPDSDEGRGWLLLLVLLLPLVAVAVWWLLIRRRRFGDDDGHDDAGEDPGSGPSPSTTPTSSVDE